MSQIKLVYLQEWKEISVWLKRTKQQKPNKNKAEKKKKKCRHSYIEDGC